MLLLLFFTLLEDIHLFVILFFANEINDFLLFVNIQLDQSLSRIINIFRIGSRPVDELDAVGHLGGVENLTVAGVGLSIEDVLQYRVIEDDGFLHYKRNRSSEVMEIHCLDIDSIQENLTLIWIIESHQQVDEGALSTSRFTN